MRGLLCVALACCSVSPAWTAEATERTASSGESRTLPGGALITFSKDAKYELGKPIKLQLSTSGSEKTPVQVVRLQAGRMRVSLPELKNPKTAVLIQAPGKVSAVAKGGESAVIVAPERVNVAALKGEMLAALGNEWKELAPGIVRSFAGGGFVEQAVLPAPKLKAAPAVALAVQGTGQSIISVERSDKVASRELVLYRVEGNARKKLAETEWRDERHTFDELAPGRYEVEARAIDRFGVESPASPPLTLRVIGAELPDGARVADGAILIGRQARVKLIGAEGLEATYGRASLFVPAPKDVGLARGQATLIRLREPGSKDELALRLEPRTLRAQVAIGPKSARWPQDPLHVSVKLFDHRGRPVTEALKTKPRVFINVEPVDPSWTHNGNTWTAKVAPPRGSGPWVVRVEVSDDFGEPVGRDFMEVGGS